MRLSILDQAPISEGQTAADALQNTIDLARLADRCGYTRYWVAEHHSLASLACPAPEILIARLGAETQRIRLGSGGVMLPHYSPFKVAELFAMLSALYPGRIDLGLGRAPGGGPLESFALRRDRKEGAIADDFGDQLLELLAFLDKDFPADHAFRRIRLPDNSLTGADVWLLGSSLWSSSAAAQLGLAYAFAHFFSGESTREAIERYHTRFRPSKYRDRPEAMAAVGVICAATQQEAEHLSLSVRVMRRRLRQGMPGPVVSPEAAARELGADADTPEAQMQEWPALFIGTPEKVRNDLKRMASDLRLEELIVVTITHDHQARRRSYQLLAEAFGLV
jgi:luciferase family oxidoreductase group 1